MENDYKNGENVTLSIGSMHKDKLKEISFLSGFSMTTLLKMWIDEKYPEVMDLLER